MLVGAPYLSYSVKENHIDAIKKICGKQWRTVGRHLPEFTLDDAEDVVSRYNRETLSDGDRFFYVVKAWAEKLGSRATVGKLLEAIDNAGVGGVAETRLLEIFKTNS